jgi:inner membrane protein involved in colicin E2 resistance
MAKRISAIVFIYVCTSIGWLILAGTVLVRTDTQSFRLREAVSRLWGTSQAQHAPVACYTSSSPRSGGGDSSKGKQHMSPKASDLNVDIVLEYRKKGLQWYSTYRVKFAGTYEFSNDSEHQRDLSVTFGLPAQNTIYDNFHFFVGEEEVENVDLQSGVVTAALALQPGRTEKIRVSYESQGMESWYYDFGESVSQVRNFSLVLQTDFAGIDFPDDSISPTAKQRTSEGWQLSWKYENLLTGVRIGLVLPEKLNPGPWVARVTSAAPVSLFLYFFILFVLTTVRKIKIHPMNFFFIGTAFFSFHLLLAYLVDHISVHTAFWICSAVSVFLVVSYMRLVVGLRLAFVEIALSQLVYLVLFSYTFFFKGFTGLAITILCICTLFVIMQATGKTDWTEIFETGRNENKTPAPPGPTG